LSFWLQHKNDPKNTPKKKKNKTKQNKPKRVSHFGLAIHIKKHLKAKKKNYENSNIISPSSENKIFKKHALKRNPKNPSRYY
jgi:hypothetical protein